MIDNLVNLFRKEYNVFKYDINKNSKHLIQFEKKESNAIYYLERLLDLELEDYCPYTKDETTLANDYLKNRDYIYKIENSNFHDITYVKINASKIYKKYLLKQ